MKYQTLKGMKDLLPAESAVWRHVERTIRETLGNFGFGEIRTPSLEAAALFIKSTGETTDIVGKEMYTLTDKGGTALALRPEMTPPVVRAYIQHNLGGESPVVKLYYISSLFRQERPQAGRLRQFHQFGVETIGAESPRADVETIAAAAGVYRALGLEQVTLKINSIGCPVCRTPYRELLRKELLAVAAALSPESRARIETNPLRALDSKDERDREATRNVPLLVDHLCNECAAHFGETRRNLDLLRIAYTIDGRIVRGLDYYTKTVFEFISEDLGAQDALGGGGRYDLLVEQMGGKPTPAVGFGAGIERLLIVLEKKKPLAVAEHPPAVYIVAADALGRERSFPLVMQLRACGIAAECDLLERSVKSQMREANRLRARFTVVIGEHEVHTGSALMKWMQTGAQQQVSLDDFATNFPLLENALSTNSIPTTR